MVFWFSFESTRFTLSSFFEAAKPILDIGSLLTRANPLWAQSLLRG